MQHYCQFIISFFGVGSEELCLLKLHSCGHLAHTIKQYNFTEYDYLPMLSETIVLFCEILNVDAH